MDRRRPPKNHTAPAHNKESDRRKLIGLGERSMRKSYYPELKEHVQELELFRVLIEQAHDALFLMRADTLQLIDVNKAACAITEMRRKELLAKRISDILDAETMASLQPFFEESPHTDTQTAIVTEIQSNSVSSRYVEITISLHRFQDVPYAVATARDITERIQGERERERLTREVLAANVELQHARDAIQNVFDSMPSALLNVSPEGRIIQWNAAARDMLSIPPEDFAGASLRKALPHLTGLMELLSEVRREGRPAALERQTYRANRQIRYADVMAFPLSGAENDGIVLRIDDVTERANMEALIVQSEKMLSIGGLAAGMAHEINNPLGIIVQAMENTQRRLSNELPRNLETAEALGLDFELLRRYLDERGIHRYLEGAREAGIRAARIVSNMLDFSRRSESFKAPHDVATLMDKVMDLAANDFDLKKKYDFRHIEIVRDYEKGLPQVHLCETEVEQVLLNLVRNAAQALADRRDDGTPPRITLRTRMDEDFVRLEVVDNGPGMDNLTRARIFEPFFTTKAVGTGTGLGLSVSYFIITTNHAGTFDVETEPGQGSRFIIRLPCFSRSGKSGVCDLPPNMRGNGNNARNAQ